MKILNKKASFDYELLEKFELGIVLLSSEVKSLRNGAASISEAYIGFKKPHFYIFNMFIAEYKNLEHETRRDRIVLLKKKERNKLLGYIQKKGATVIPLELFWNNKGFAKILCAAAIGKKKYDKRLAIKQKEMRRENKNYGF